MAFTRPTVNETCYIKKYQLVNESGTITEGRSSSISISSYYSFSGWPDGGSQYEPKTFQAIKFLSAASESQYKTNYRKKEGGRLVKFYITGVSPEGWTVDRPYYCRIKETGLYPSDVKHFLAFSSSAGAAWKRGWISLPFYNWVGAIMCMGSYYRDGITDSVYATISGIGSSDAPYESITWERCDPLIDSVTPASGSFVDDSHDIKISWNADIATSESGVTYPVTELAFLWGTSKDDLNNVIDIDPSATSFTIPANTFPVKGSVYWQIRWKSDITSEYLYTDAGWYSTNDVTPSVQIVSPVNASIDGSVDNVFRWNYLIDTASPQRAFDLQISNNKGSSWIDVFNHAEQSETSATVPADTFLAGTGMWRVRAYNTDNTVSEWSDVASIVVRAAPQPPTFSKVSTTPKITVEWQSVGQQGYQIKADEYDSGAMFGTGKVFTIPRYYEDGKTVSISLRIKNRFGEWSEWAETKVTIANTPLGEITASVNVEDNAAVISSSRIDGVDRYYVLRDGKAIGKISDQTYKDYGACGAHEYRVMAVDDSGNYAVSEIVKATVLPKAAVIGIVRETVEWVHLLKRRGNEPEIQTKKSEDISYQFYSGRTLPVAYSSKFITREKQLSYTVYKAESDRLETMIGRIVIYKDYAGNKIFGILNDLELSGKATRPDVTMTITEIDYSEEIAYD